MTKRADIRVTVAGVPGEVERAQKVIHDALTAAGFGEPSRRRDHLRLVTNEEAKR